MERYCIIRQLGHGAFGTVFLAQDKYNLSEVAIKVLKKSTDSLDGT